MKITEKALNKLLEQNEIEFEIHERVPFFIADKDSVFTVEQGEEIVEINVLETYYSETHMGITYVKMDSTSRNPDGTFDGAEPTSYVMGNSYSLERQALWVDQLGEAISATQMLEIRRISAMTELEYRQEKANMLEAKKKPKYIEFIAPAKGKVIEFKVDIEDIVDTTAQLSMLADGTIDYMLIHDKYHQVEPRYTYKEALPIIGVMTYIKKKLMLPIDTYLKRLWALSDTFTREDVDKALYEPFTKLEIEEITKDLMNGATEELMTLINQLYE